MRTRYARGLAAAVLLIAGLSAAAPVFADAIPPRTGGSFGTTPQSDQRTPIVTEVPIPVAGTVPGSTADRINDYLTSGKVEDVAQYIGIIYNFLISVAGMVAAVMMVVAGFQYLTSAGDSGKIGAAKSRMANALIGLVLALGAYTILNTINPRLLQLKLPDMRAVTTELFTLPWCEDIKVPVTPFGDKVTCGYAGKYMQGNSEQICIYAGACRALRISEDTTDVGETPDDDEKNGMYATCLQRSDVQAQKVKEELQKDKNAKFAECLYCADMTAAKAKSMGFDTETSCRAWMNAFDSVPAAIKDAAANERAGRSDIKDGFFHVCYPRTIKSVDFGGHHYTNAVYGQSQGCMGAPIFCYNVTRNVDCTACSSGGDDNLSGCEGYDEEPSPSFAGSLTSEGYAKARYTYDEDGMEEYPVHLGTLCASNPCLNFHDPTDKMPFAKGCKSGNGIIFAAQRVVRHGDIGAIDDCRNQ
ncbi:MAG TPA: hypothetical protein VL283_04670 [Candidatus Baltobacteraceae bacterium]|jgi:hypothetical protein|nr:hypothetical protein [Candidatus Baltobacteraceae bacterium]